VAETQKISRKELKEMVKHDAFRDRAIETVEYVSEHKSEVGKYVIGALVLVLLAGGFLYYRSYQKSVRQAALAEALDIYGGTVSENPPPFATKVYKTQDEKTKAIRKSFTELAQSASGTDEGAMANIYLGIHWADSGDMAQAEKHFKTAADSSSKEFASMAKLSLAQLYKSQGKIDEAEKLLRPYLNEPTTFLSKEAAAIEIARMIGQTKPDEARKLLEPLRSGRPVVSRNALTALSELPKK
jgi:predicted negative regulator of RcsB-dependent stress response